MSKIRHKNKFSKTSAVSRFKKGDNVVTVNNPRIGYGQDTVIGFDPDVDAHLKNCAWENQRGGYSDGDLILYTEFVDFKSNPTPKALNGIEEALDDHQNWRNKNRKKGEPYEDIRTDKKLFDVIVNSYIANNWSKFKPFKAQVKERGGVYRPDCREVKIGETIMPYDLVLMSSTVLGPGGKTTIGWECVWKDYENKTHSNPNMMIIRKK